MLVDLIYVSHHRLAFTVHTFEALVANTNWARIRKLVLYDDWSQDGTWEYLQARVAEGDLPVQVELQHQLFGSPVHAMNHYVDHNGDSDFFVKVDNDIMCPPGWLTALLDVLEASPELDVLGMEGGRIRCDPDHRGPYSWTPCRWIGGVGAIRTSFLGTTRRMKVNGQFFGWTEHQKEFKPTAGWITPDLAVCCLDQVPFEPWQTHAADYVAREWSRWWPQYFAVWMHWYWAWWAPDERGRDL